MLVTMVDRRDPYAACHSACVATVARAVAAGMGLGHERVETAEVAGKLMNIGKIVVPSEVLTKPAALTGDEIRKIHESIQSSIGLLEKIEFDGPVVDTLRQSQERYDGSGPLKMKGEDILITARIIAVANAFVAMISVRAYRQALGQDQALKILLGEIGTQFDRRVVVALADYVENKQGRDEIAKLIPAEPAAPV
jgi:HD-GYP domain-containing protein (c-di-GMP phosphodiesterase class II)